MNGREFTIRVIGEILNAVFSWGVSGGQAKEPEPIVIVHQKLCGGVAVSLASTVRTVIKAAVEVAVRLQISRT